MRDMRQPRTYDGDPPYPLREPNASIGQLVGRITGEMSGLVNDHVQLARIEMMRDAKKAGRGAGFMGGAGIGGWIAALILSFALAWGLAEVLPAWAAFLIVGLLWAIVAAALWMIGKREFDRFGAVAPETMDELERDRQWWSRQIS